MSGRISEKTMQERLENEKGKEKGSERGARSVPWRNHACVLGVQSRNRISRVQRGAGGAM